MPGSLQNRFSGHEEMPPPDAWSKISGRLDEEFSSADAILSARMENLTIAPPPVAINHILEVLHATDIEPAQPPAKVFPIIYKRFAIAVILAAVVAVGVMYIFSGRNAKSPFTKPANVAVTPKPVTSEDPSQPTSQKQPAAENDTNLNSKTLIASNQHTSHAPANERKKVYAGQDYSPPDLPESHSIPFEPVNALQPISVSAPLIRDSHGNIIMDLRLITKPGQPYVTVTGPNGNQTRISNKFLNCLSYINGNNSSGEMDDAANDCKEKFAEWRNKLLSEAAFIPAANNFFDIFELKEMIQD